MQPKQGYRVPTASVDSPFQCEEIIKGSRFIGRAVFSPTVEQAKAFIKSLNIAEPEATHHCWAYIVGNPASTTLIACSDDGEPSGTAGMPMLNVLKHGAIGDITIVVTRYYGGTKLGTGGLARAYGGSVKLALEQLTTSTRIYTRKILVKAPYDLHQQVEYLLKEHQAKITDTAYHQTVAIEAQVPQDQANRLLASFEAYQDKLTYNLE